MALNYKTSDVHNKRDIIDTIDQCIQVAYKFNGYIYGSFVRNALVPLYYEESSIDKSYVEFTVPFLFEVNRNKVDVDFDCIDFYFPNQENLDAFVKEMGQKLVYKHINNSSQSYKLIRLGAHVTDIGCTITKPVYDISLLGYHKNRWQITHACTVTRKDLFNKIKQKKVELLDHAILNLKNESDIRNRFEHLKKLLYQGWTVTIGNQIMTTDDYDAFVALLKTATAQIIKIKYFDVNNKMRILSEESCAKNLEKLMEFIRLANKFDGFIKNRSCPNLNNCKVKLYFNDQDKLEAYKTSIKDKIDDFNIIKDAVGYISCKVLDINKYKFDIDKAQGYYYGTPETCGTGPCGMADKGGFSHELYEKLRAKKLSILPYYREKLLTDDKEVEKFNKKYYGWSFSSWSKNDYGIPMDTRFFRSLLSSDAYQENKKSDNKELVALLKQLVVQINEAIEKLE